MATITRPAQPNPLATTASATHDASWYARNRTNARNALRSAFRDERRDFTHLWRDHWRYGKNVTHRLGSLEAIARDAENDLVVAAKLSALGECESPGDGDAT